MVALINTTTTTAGMNIADMRSASWPISSLPLCACRTSLVMRASMVLLPLAAAWNSMLLLSITVLRLPHQLGDAR